MAKKTSVLEKITSSKQPVIADAMVTSDGPVATSVEFEGTKAQSPGKMKVAYDKSETVMLRDLTKDDPSEVRDIARTLMEKHPGMTAQEASTQAKLDWRIGLREYDAKISASAEKERQKGQLAIEKLKQGLGSPMSKLRQKEFERTSLKDVGGASYGLATSAGGGLTELGVAAMKAASDGGGRINYREPPIPVTTPEVNPFIVPHPNESFVAYGTKQLEMANANSFTAYGSDNLMQGTYNPKKGALEQIGTDTIMKGAAAPQMNMLENLGEKEISEATNIMPNARPDAGVNLTDTGKSVMGATSPGNALVELGEKRQSEILKSTESTQSVGLSGIGAKLMNEHATLCNSCKKKEL